MPVPEGSCCGLLRRETTGRAQVLRENVGNPELMRWDMPGRETPGEASADGFVQVRGASPRRVGLWMSHQEAAGPEQDVGTWSGRLMPYGSRDCVSNWGS